MAVGPQCLLLTQSGHAPCEFEDFTPLHHAIYSIQKGDTQEGKNAGGGEYEGAKAHEDQRRNFCR